ncbi:MAG: M1 family aminopeptidase [Pseudomonadota bacterium]
MLLLTKIAVAAPVQHKIRVTLQPAAHTIQVDDLLTFEARREIIFELHAGLKPKLLEPVGKLIALPAPPHGVPIETYKIQFREPQTTLHLSYGGVLHHPLQTAPLDALQGEMASPGIIDTEGVYLAASSAWYPRMIEPDQRVNFALTVDVPTHWSVISQGERLGVSRSSKRVSFLWEERNPQYDIYIIAAPFVEYWGSSEKTAIAAYLRQAEPALAERYLHAADRYLKFYSGLLGPYPYGKFALVENFWQTGYGMPSFTLIGSKIIRLPFVIDTSFPHEIVHNWWGNGVVAADEGGNWSEGLTSYLADHLIQEQRGNGAEYRRTALQKYADYVAGDKDIPLRLFRGRESRATEAVGYGKSMMFFHMLRRMAGDAAFVTGLRNFYTRYRFSPAKFSDFRGIFKSQTEESVADFMRHRADMDAHNMANIDTQQHALSLLSLAGEEIFFNQWLDIAGAPALRLDSARVVARAGDFQLQIALTQTQTEPAFVLDIPIVATFADGSAVTLHMATGLTYKNNPDAVQPAGPHNHTSTAQWNLPKRPVRIDVDPDFDVFRLLDKTEAPVALSAAFGAHTITVIVPDTATPDFQIQARVFADALQTNGDVQVTVTDESALNALPNSAAIWVLGQQNRWALVAHNVLKSQRGRIDATSLTLPGAEPLSRATAAAIVIATHAQSTLVWVATERAADLPILLRKLPHYGKYSFLGFRGTELTNVVKGQWSVQDSILARTLDGRDLAATPRGTLPTREALHSSTQ